MCRMRASCPTVRSTGRSIWRCTIEDGEAAGYIDLTHNSAENEPYDLFVRKESRRRGLGRALLSAAVQENRPNGMALLVDIDNEAAIALYESQGFDRAEGENNITAHICL